MCEQERKRIRFRRTNMKEMDVEPVQGCAILAEVVKHRFAAAPVISISPVGAQRANFFERSALAPILHGFLFWPARACETLPRSEEHTSDLKSLMRISSAVLCLKKKKHSARSTL